MKTPPTYVGNLLLVIIVALILSMFYTAMVSAPERQAKALERIADDLDALAKKK